MSKAQEVFELAEAAPQRPQPAVADHDAGEAWPQIVSFGAPTDLPEFPVQALPEVVRAYVAEVAESRSISVDYPATVALGAMATACAKRYEVAVGQTHTEPTNIYTVTLLESGERKSAAFGDIMFPITEYEHELRSAAAPRVALAKEHFQQEEEQLKSVRQAMARARDQAKRDELRSLADRMVAERTVVPQPPTLRIRDATPEHVAMVMAANGSRIAQIDPEGGAFFKMIGGQYSKDGHNNIEIYLSGHCGEAFSVGRVTRDAIDMNKPAITLVLSGQPDLIRRLKDKEELRHRGLLARMLFSLPRSLMGERFYCNRQINESVRVAYAAMLRRALAMESVANAQAPDACRVLRIENEALDIWTQFHDETERSLGPEGALRTIKDWGSKLSGAVARIAGLLHVMGGPVGTAISAGTVSAASDIGNYFRAHALAAFDLMDGGDETDQARRVLDWIRRHRKQRFSRAQVYDDLRHGESICSSADLDAPLAVLADRNYIRLLLVPVQGRGRPSSPNYEVNPLTHDSNGANRE